MEFYENEPMRYHTTFRTGGPAKYFYKVSSIEDLIKVLDECNDKKIKYTIIGNGSNLLVSDLGYDGAIIQIYDKFDKISVSGNIIKAEAGALLSKIAAVARNNGLTGMEFASGIPGTLGGAVVMNAGAYGGEMQDLIESVDVLSDGMVRRYTCEEMKFGYRKSILTENKGMVVTGATIRLMPADKEEISKRMRELNRQRTLKQPLEYPSAGSTFKRPEGHFAGKLIMDSGLSGYKIGGAMVSPKHCGFVINTGDATSQDIYNLIIEIREKVYRTYGVSLEPEVRIIGDF